MEVGADVWIKDNKGSWCQGIIQSKELIDNDKYELVIRDILSDIETIITLDNKNQDLDNVKLRNNESESDVENLINLPYLHEPALLFCLERRYEDGNIYTYTGPILIAMNPFKTLPLYTPKILEAYYNDGLMRSQGINATTILPPHVYAIADASYRNMMNSIMQGIKTNDKSSKSIESPNQSILISGESGAGKTESTKIVLRYLTSVGNSNVGIEIVTGSIMDKILQSNPILEAFGNARTLRNDNSSRFGKFIELNFNRRGHLIGGGIRTYLLEKVRLNSHSIGERNFHIFYQMGTASQDEKTKWKITDTVDFEYCNQGKIKKLKHVDDVQEFKHLKNALDVLNFDKEDQEALFKTVAGLMHLGQIKFNNDSDEGSIISNDSKVQESLNIACDFLGLNPDQLSRCLTVRMIYTRDDTIEKKLLPAQAIDARDALSKSIYGLLFDWIVKTINISINIDRSQVRADIGVLDIFGFECFENNSFEQLCINYTNETLQQHFNQFVFKMEQAEYQREQISWSFIEFPDNQDCLDLIDLKPTGVLAMIDDECRLPTQSDEKLASRMYKALENHHRFSASAPQKRDSKFAIRHYAGLVVYNTKTFVDKNKDELPREAKHLMQNSSINFMAKLFKEENAPVVASGGKVVTPTVAAQFKEQLASLMSKISTTKPHYIRCLKPNDDNLPDAFHRIRITEQLRYGGVLEAVRVARSGFPVRLTHTDFFHRYRAISNPHSPEYSTLPWCVDDAKANSKELCGLLLDTLWTSSSSSTSISTSTIKSMRKLADIVAWQGSGSLTQESIQIGLTKTFLRKAAHDELESRRARRLNIAARKLQSIYRCMGIRRMFLSQRWAANTIQRFVRGMFARIRVQILRELRAVVRIQTSYRSHLHYDRYLRLKTVIIIAQSYFRGLRARKVVKALKYNIWALRLQRIFIGGINKIKYKRFRRAIVILQSLQRKKDAKKQLITLRINAKDVGRLQQSNEALKAEIELLRKNAADEAVKMQLKLQAELEAKAVEDLQSELRLKSAEIRAKEAELKNQRLQYIILEDDLNDLRAALEKERELRIKAEEALADSSIKVESAEVSLGNLSIELSKERDAKMALEKEMDRLRSISYDLSVQVDTLKRNSGSKENLTNTRTITTPSARRNSNEDYNDDDDTPPNSVIKKLNLEAPRRGSYTRDRSFSNEKNKDNASTSSKWGEAAFDSNTDSDGKSPLPVKRSKFHPERRDSPNVVTEESRAAILRFERQWENFDRKITDGIIVTVWEGRAITKQEVKMRILNKHIIFEKAPVKKFTMISLLGGGKVEVGPIKLSDVLECVPGSEIFNPDNDHTDDAMFMTLVARNGGDPRIIAVLFETRDERNMTLLGIRDILAHASQQRTPTNKGLRSLENEDISLSSSSSVPTSTVRRPSRRLSVRDTVLEEMMTSPSAEKSPSSTGTWRENLTPAAGQEINTLNNVNETKRQLLLERSNYERLMMQMLSLTTDLNEKEDQLANYKNREYELKQTLLLKERVYEQDTQSRLQLVKKLEQVLMDKEEEREENELLREQILNLRTIISQLGGHYEDVQHGTI